MLRYFKKNNILYWFLLFFLLFLFSAIAAALSGGSTSNPIVIALVLVGTLATTIVITSFWEKKKAQSILNLMLQECDPDSYLQQSDPIVKKIPIVRNSWDACFLSVTSLALYESDHLDSAVCTLDYMTDAVNIVDKSYAYAFAFYYAKSPAIKIRGVDSGIEFLKQAEKLFVETKKKEKYKAQLLFIEEDCLYLTALRDHKNDQIVALGERVLLDTTRSMISRVFVAFQMAEAWQSLGDSAQEKQCLEFVVEHGNELACVKEAEERLSVL